MGDTGEVGDDASRLLHDVISETKIVGFLGLSADLRKFSCLEMVGSV